jgi:serine/threonine-protein kinase
MKSSLAAMAVAAALLQAAAARAQPGDASAQADALFKEAMDLRAAGNDAAACPKFLASKQLAPAVGVTLYLADCYERIGRNASAWREFREGEKLARARNDKRADVAAQRAAALEPTLGRLTVSAPAPAKTGTEVSVDGASLPREYWGSALAVDPGDHVVSVMTDGQPAKTYVAHVDASHPTAVVSIGETATSPPPASAPASTAAVEATPTETTPPSDHRLAGRIGGIGLMVIGAAGVGLGTWLVTDKITQMPNGQVCEPHLRPNAIPEAAAAFSVGGVALISGAIMFYVNRAGRAETAIAPTVMPGGGGAVLRGTF